MLHLRAVSRKTARSLKTVKITVVLGRLGAPVPLTLHLSWGWRLKIEIGLGRKNKTEQKLNQKWRVSKTAFKKTAFRSFRDLVLIDLAFVVPRFESCDWRSFV